MNGGVSKVVNIFLGDCFVFLEAILRAENALFAVHNLLHVYLHLRIKSNYN